MEKPIYALTLEEFTEVLQNCLRKELAQAKPAEKQEDELLKIADVAKLFRVSKVTLNKWRKKGILPYHRIASRVYFKKAELIEALNTVQLRRRRIQ